VKKGERSEKKQSTFGSSAVGKYRVPSGWQKVAPVVLPVGKKSVRMDINSSSSSSSSSSISSIGNADDASRDSGSVLGNVGNSGSSSDQYLPGAASLLEQLDKPVMIILRDGRHLVGTLRSFDQFLNLIVEDTCERVLLKGKYCDVPLGLYIVRGDTIVLVGEIERGLEELESVPPEQITEELSEQAGELRIQWDFE
jgi:U6 snRNA-associated Sm-like protein LSm1